MDLSQIRSYSMGGSVGLLALLAWTMLVPACSNTSSSGGDDTETQLGTAHESDGDTEVEGTLGNTFRFGINGGHRNASWGDDVQAGLEAAAGCNSQRISLPERHLDKWGYDIEVNDMKAYAALGMAEQVAFLTEPIRAHSTAPDTAADWELAHYIPAKLYEPAILPSGEINPGNYWAKYVFDTVSTYKNWIKVWEIWNEPDFVSDWRATLTWDESPPTREQLIRFNGSIFDYVRMLRVSREAARLADPEALIATGGIGYASFLHALLRYTDNPEDGSITDAYPKTGAAYFDVLSFHHYPIYTDGNADDAVEGYLSHFNELVSELEAAGKTVVGFENTETGAPRLALGDYPGGPDYARAYLMKTMISAQAAGIHGIDWFVLSDGAVDGASDDPYKFMGLYKDIVDLESTDQAVLTDTGKAFATLGDLLGRARLIEDFKPWENVDPAIKGAAFQTVDEKLALALWTVDTGSGAPTLELAIEEDKRFSAYAWNASETGASTRIDPDGGVVHLPVSGEVTLFVAD